MGKGIPGALVGGLSQGPGKSGQTIQIVRSDTCPGTGAWRAPFSQLGRLRPRGRICPQQHSSYQTLSPRLGLWGLMIWFLVPLSFHIYKMGKPGTTREEGQYVHASQCAQCVRPPFGASRRGSVPSLEELVEWERAALSLWLHTCSGSSVPAPTATLFQ